MTLSTLVKASGTPTETRMKADLSKPETRSAALGHTVFDRRALLSGLGATGGLFASRAFASGAERRLTPEMFGAKGDGQTDDYEALKRLADATAGSDGALVTFRPNARYRIERMQITGGPRKHLVPPIMYQNCKRLTVDLQGATIDVKGNFHRGFDEKRGRHSFSYSQQVEPFAFVGCESVVLRNGFMTGNADRITADPEVVEGTGRGITLVGCRGVLLQDLHVHHFARDGMQIYPGADGGVSTDIRLLRVRLTNNARQGLSNSGGARVEAIDSVFSENGFTGGHYYHAPCAGVDVEPNSILATRSDFTARSCRFDNNRGSPVVAGNPDTDSLVELIDCNGTCPTQRRMILSAGRSLVRGGTWHNIQIACAYAAHRAFRHDIVIEVTGALWSGDDPAWAPVYDMSPRQPSVYIHHNRFDLRPPRPFTSTYLFQCGNPNERFENNDIFVGRTGHDGKDLDLIGRFTAGIVRGNRWTTDALPPARFVNSYHGAKIAYDESFAGAFGRFGSG